MSKPYHPSRKQLRDAHVIVDGEIESTDEYFWDFSTSAPQDSDFISECYTGQSMKIGPSHDEWN